MILILMGVAGAGKTTIGRRLAGELGWGFYEGDDFHPPENVAKMARGVPLTDADRQPWLRSLRERIEDLLASGENAVITCSALKRGYRERLAGGDERVRFVHLAGHPDLIRRRIDRRLGHYMKPELLESQYADLEPPSGALTLDVAASSNEIVRRIREAFAI